MSICRSTSIFHLMPTQAALAQLLVDASSSTLSTINSEGRADSGKSHVSGLVESQGKVNGPTKKDEVKPRSHVEGWDRGIICH